MPAKRRIFAVSTRAATTFCIRPVTSGRTLCVRLTRDSGSPLTSGSPGKRAGRFRFRHSALLLRLRLTMEKFRPLLAEFVGTFALIFVGIGAIFHMGRLTNNAGLLTIALAHGLTIAVMVSATGHISGRHLNPALT